MVKCFEHLVVTSQDYFLVVRNGNYNQYLRILTSSAEIYRLTHTRTTILNTACVLRTITGSKFFLVRIHLPYINELIESSLHVGRVKGKKHQHLKQEC